MNSDEVKPRTVRTALAVGADLVLLVICLSHIPSVLSRPGAPFEVISQHDTVVITRILDIGAAGELRTGDLLLSLGDVRIAFPEMVEYAIDLFQIETQVPLTVNRDGAILRLDVSLIPYYASSRFLIISLFAGLAMFCIGLFVFVSRSEDPAARALHWTLIAFGVTIMTTWGAIAAGAFQTYVSRTVWFLAYAGVATGFFFFTLTFPKSRARWLSRRPGVVVGIVLGIGASMSYTHLLALHSGSTDDYLRFQTLFDLFHGSLFLFIGSGIVNIARAVATVATVEERQKLYWIVWGLCIGTAPYLLLHVLPQLLLSQYLLPEEFTTVFFLAIPFSFAIALVKYRFLDVEVVINRSIVYFVLTFFILSAYVLVVLLLTSIIGGEEVFEHSFLAAGGALLVSFAVYPLRTRLQRVVDETLFSAKANFRRLLTDATERLHRALNPAELFKSLIDSAHSITRFEAIAVYSSEPGKLVLEEFRGSILHRTLALKKEHQSWFSVATVFAAPEALAFQRKDIDLSKAELLKKLGCEVCVPLLSKSNELLGVLVGRPGASSVRFNEEEVDFLIATCTQAAGGLERLLLQERMIIEHREKKRFEELSNLKTDFVSYVSHELRTPITSIKLYADLLRPALSSDNRKALKYLRTIEGETARLNRMVSTILDSAKIESQAKEYLFSTIDLRDVCRRVLKSMSYQIDEHRFVVRFKSARGRFPIRGDAESLELAFSNLVLNAIKYSPHEKYFGVSLSKKGGWVVCRFEDRGLGISEDALPHLFEKFYRDPSHHRQIQGVGLGLSLVKHVIDAHAGTIEVKSKIGRGSTFVMRFPLVHSSERKG